MGFTIGDMVRHRARFSPSREGFVGQNYRYTFQEVNNRANQWAAYLTAQNVKAGDRVAVLCKNEEHIGTVLFGSGKIGVITVLLNWRLQGAELSYILSDCGATMLVYDAEFAQTVEELKPHIPTRSYVCVGGSEASVDFHEALAGSSADEPAYQGTGDDAAVIMYTSGTTGRPKGAVLSHNNLLASSMAISHSIVWNRDHRFLLMAPLFHIGGLAPLITNVHTGAMTYFLPNFDPGVVWKIIAQEKITTMMSVPLMLQAMLMVAKAMPVDPSSLVTITCGASAVPETLIRTYLEMGVKVQQVYGITEYSGAVTFWTHDMPLETCNSQGKSVFHGELKVVDPATGIELPTGNVGEIVCTGPMTFTGYWNNPEATEAALVDGWYRTGDLGKKDEEGFVYVVDRLKDMIISGGENIYPAELETVILSHEAVAEVAVVGRPDPKWGEIPRAYVVKKPDKEVVAEEIVQLCRERLASYKCVKEVRFVDALPKNPVGKVLKTVLRAQEG